MRPDHDQPRPRRVRARGCRAGLAVRGPLFAGRVLYYRDVGVTYYPDFVFVSRALAQGVWPLWHPGADAGAPFLMAYPVHLALLLLGGPGAALAVSPPLHLLSRWPAPRPWRVAWAPRGPPPCREGCSGSAG